MVKKYISKLNALRNIIKRGGYSLDDMKWAFEKGIHEGKLREHYKNNSDSFSKSELEYYFKYKK